MIVSTKQQKAQLEERLRTKTVEQIFLRSIQEGANCPPFVARTILEVARSTFNLEGSSYGDLRKIKPGQMKVIGISASEPPGKPLKECTLAEAVITLDAGIEDRVTRLTGGRTGVTTLRRKRLLRITSEAVEQNVLLTREDIAYRILNCGIHTVTRDVQYSQNLGIYVPLRGWQKDIGPTLTHEVQIVNWYIKRMQPSEIARRTYHSLEAVERYILNFAKVGYLSFQYRGNLSPSEIAFLVSISERLVREYQTLYHRYNNRYYYYRQRLREIVSLAHGSPPPIGGKKGGTLP